MRRTIGIAGIEKTQQQNAKFRETGNEIAKVQLKQMEEQMELFKRNLEQFAQKYKREINKNPEFRKHFNEMCAKIGVDPLVSQKGFWTELLGVGDFYYELAVQIVDVSLKTRQINGGLISLIELTQRLKQMRGSTAQDISTDDIERAVKKLKVLGKGFEILSVGSTKMLQTVPCELNTDHMTVMVLAQEKGYVTASELMREMKWTQSRVDVVMGLLLQEGMVWVDDQASERQFWFPSIFSSINKVEI